MTKNEILDMIEKAKSGVAVPMLDNVDKDLYDRIDDLAVTSMVTLQILLDKGIITLDEVKAAIIKARQEFDQERAKIRDELAEATS